MPAPGTPGNIVPPGEDAMVRRIADLERSVRELAPSVYESILPMISDVAAAAAQASSAAAQASAAAATASAATARLAVEVARINALVAAQVDGSTGSASAAPTLNTTPTGHAAITFTVPAGYTRARVMATSAMYMGGTVASILRTQINGANGPDMYAFTNSAYANAAASHAASLSGLSGGATFSVQSVANTTTGSTSGVIITSASVMWLK